MFMSIKSITIVFFNWDLVYFYIITLRLKILRAAECCCEDIDENDENHHNPNADVDTEKKCQDVCSVYVYCFRRFITYFLRLL